MGVASTTGPRRASLGASPTTRTTRDEFQPAELDRLHALYNGRAADGGPAGIGVQARDRLIRKLIDELKLGSGGGAEGQA